MNRVFMVAARRTAVVPRGGAFSRLNVHELAAPVFRTLLSDCAMAPADVEAVILGNALYGGGNPARMAALAAGLTETVPAMTVDTQCCAGMDAIGLAAAQIRSGQFGCVLAGGAESFSRAPLRAHRPLNTGDEPVSYDRPPFTPWPHRDPDMAAAAAMLADRYDLSRSRQEAYAMDSHRKAVASRAELRREIVPVNGQRDDAFSRTLTPAFCTRLKPLAGNGPCALTAATIAVQADAAAAVLLMGEEIVGKFNLKSATVEIIDNCAIGGDPEIPVLAPVRAVQKLLARQQLAIADCSVVELMEAFAVQGILVAGALEVGEGGRVNRRGGALARGHPIGASGAINMVRLWREMQSQPPAAFGLAAIAAAGGLGSAVLVRR
jgi:acetyl-CoA C-acetyltransferase